MPGLDEGGTVFAGLSNMERRRIGEERRRVDERPDRAAETAPSQSRRASDRVRGAAEFSDILDRLSKGVHVPPRSTKVTRDD
jgi:hypothetical protein